MNAREDVKWRRQRAPVWISAVLLALQSQVWIATGCTGSSPGPGAADPDARRVRSDATAAEVLEACREVYASCSSYRDEGNVHSKATGGMETMESSGAFSTRFERSGSFEFEQEGSRFGESLNYRIESKDQGARVVWNGRSSEKETIAQALVEANGVCDGAPCQIAMLLKPRTPLVGTDVANLSELRRLEDEELAGTMCFKIEGSQAFPQLMPDFPEESEVTIWIGRDDLLIRRVQSEASSSIVQLWSTLEYRPALER